MCSRELLSVSVLRAFDPSRSQRGEAGVQMLSLTRAARSMARPVSSVLFLTRADRSVARPVSEKCIWRSVRVQSFVWLYPSENNLQLSSRFSNQELSCRSSLIQRVIQELGPSVRRPCHPICASDGAKFLFLLLLLVRLKVLAHLSTLQRSRDLSCLAFKIGMRRASGAKKDWTRISQVSQTAEGLVAQLLWSASTARESQSLQ